MMFELLVNTMSACVPWRFVVLGRVMVEVRGGGRLRGRGRIGC